MVDSTLRYVQGIQLLCSSSHFEFVCSADCQLRAFIFTDKIIVLQKNMLNPSSTVSSKWQSLYTRKIPISTNPHQCNFRTRKVTRPTGWRLMPAPFLQIYLPPRVTLTFDDWTQTLTILCH